ncbi:MAG TPA: TolC family protein [Candidatus Acidoferrales bacterium]|nr:TolC family protein [Candidatus Acidoferrales bacterium]
MTGRLIRVVVAVYLVASLAVGAPAFAQAPQQSSAQTQTQTTATTNGAARYTSILFSRDYGKGHRALPNIFAPYMSDFVPQPTLTNGPTIYNLIHDGKIEISLQDAIALTLENNLNIGVAEYTPWLDEANLLNAKGGGTPLATGAVQVGSGGGNFDPVIGFNTSINDQSTTINNPLTSGVGTSGVLTQASHNTQFNLSYAQEFHSGTNFQVALDNSRSSSTPSENFFNPAISSNLAVAIEQPLLNGFGFLPHTRFILEAKNTDKIGVLQFQEQVITSVTQVVTQYWNLVADQQALEATKQTLAAYQKLYDDEENMLKIGTATPSEVVTAESYLAGGNQALLGFEAAERQQEAAVLGLITKDPSDPKIKGLEVVPTTTPEDSPQAPSISLDDATKEALANRPELKVWGLTLQNDSYDVRATKNALLPTLNVTGEYVSFGLNGNAAGAFTPNGTFLPGGTEIVDQNGNPVLVGGSPIFVGVPQGTVGPTIPGGIGGAFSQIFQNQSPEYFGSLSLSLPLRNRSAQAINAETKLRQRQDQVNTQFQKSTVITAVNEALSAVNVFAAQVQAAVKATEISQQAYDYEVKKFALAQSTTFLVAQYNSILNGAKLSELQAKANYEIALANFNQALGRTLTANSITIASTGKPAFDFDGNVPLIPGTLDGHLSRQDVSPANQQR